MTETIKTAARPTILPPEMRGIMFISGLRGWGKSFLASQADLPDNIIFIDFENKGEGIDEQLDFGKYTAPVQDSHGDPLTLYKNVQTIIDEIPKNRYTVAILDNVSPLELALNAEASNNAAKYAKIYGLNLKNIQAGRFGGTKAVANFMISDLCSRMHGKGIKLIISTSHMSKRWSVGGQIPNKYNMKGADRWQELSILTLILIIGDNPPIPSALVQKEQLGTISIDQTDLSPATLDAMRRGQIGHTISKRLPPKISECTFQNIRKYLYEPANYSKLLPQEIPSVEEADPYDSKLNKEQMQIAMAAANIQQSQEKEDEEIANALAIEETDTQIIKQIEELFEKSPTMVDSPSPTIAKELGKTVPEIISALAKVKGG